MDVSSPTITFRRRFGGAALFAGTALFAAAELLYPTEGHDPASEIAANAAHHGQLLAAIGCGLVSSILFIPALFALMNPLRRRGTVLGHLGGGMAILGFAVSGLALTGVQYVVYEASSPGVDRHAVATFISQATSDPVGAPLVMGHYFIVLGIVLLAVGLLRGRVGYRWAAIALAGGPLLDAVLGSTGLEATHTGALAATVVSDLVWLAGAAGLAWWQLTTSDAEWEGDPAARPSAPPVEGRRGQVPATA